MGRRLRPVDELGNALGTPDGVVLSIGLTTALDPRATGVAVIAAPTTVEDGSLDMKTTCLDGTIVLEMGRRAFDEAGKLGPSTVELRVPLHGLARHQRYAFLPCWRTADGSLATPRASGAEAATAGVSSTTVVAPTRPVSVVAHQGYDCQLWFELDVRPLAPDVQSIALAVPPHHGPPSVTAKSQCTPVGLDLPRALLDEAIVISGGAVATFLVQLEQSDHITCDGEYDVSACARSPAGLVAFEPFATFDTAGPTCVAEGTLIDTPSGREPVETLAPGDVVLSYDLESARVALVRVRSVRIRDEAAVARFELSTGQHLDVTAEHPLFVASLGVFAAAREVDSGALLLAEAGEVRVVGRSGFDRRARVFDVSVSGTHTYFASGVLVHNY
jgi:hypothetical protein